jgi:hypothetical protein
MKDDPKFNINFMLLVEKQRCLYDHTSADYSNRSAQDRAWEIIAQELSEPGMFQSNIFITVV